MREKIVPYTVNVPELRYRVEEKKTIALNRKPDGRLSCQRIADSFAGVHAQSGSASARDSHGGLFGLYPVQQTRTTYHTRTRQVPEVKTQTQTVMMPETQTRMVKQTRYRMVPEVQTKITRSWYQSPKAELWNNRMSPSSRSHSTKTTRCVCLGRSQYKRPSQYQMGATTDPRAHESMLSAVPPSAISGNAGRHQCLRAILWSARSPLFCLVAVVVCPPPPLIESTGKRCQGHF